MPASGGPATQHTFHSEGASLEDITPDGTRGYVANLANDSVSVIDTSAGTVVSAMTVGTTPTALTIAPDGRTAYVANQLSNTVSVIALDTFPEITTTALPDGTAGTAYSTTVASTGRPAPALSLTSGTLPPGLSLDAASGQISGTPTTLGSYPGLQVRATDSASRTALSAIFGISVSSSLDIAGNPARFATVGQPYTVAFTATGGVGAKTFSLATGQLPAGLTFDPAGGLISGTPTAKGMSPAIAVRVRDASNSAATAPAPCRCCRRRKRRRR